MTHISDCGGVDLPIICVVCHGNDVVWTSHMDDADMGHGDNSLSLGSCRDITCLRDH